RLVLRVPARRLIAGCLLVIVGATLVRAEAPTAWLVVAATLPLGIGIAIIGVALPGVIKTRFPQRTGAAMGAYVAALSIGASVTALTMVPLTNALEGWRGAFVVSAIPTLVCLPLWLLLPRAGTVTSDPEAERVRAGPRPVRPSPALILLLAAIFGLQ